MVLKLLAHSPRPGGGQGLWGSAAGGSAAEGSGAQQTGAGSASGSGSQPSHWIQQSSDQQQAVLARKLGGRQSNTQSDRKTRDTRDRRSLDVLDEEREKGREAEWEASGEYGKRNLQCGENLGKLLHFFGISDPLHVTWSHATNSQAKLDKALDPESRIMFLEGDVSWGTCRSYTGSVMAHPPRTSSDLTFEDFLQRVCDHNRNAKHNRRVGVKFDFKDERCIVPCLELLQHYAGTSESVGFPVWINADVWMGPGGKKPAITPSEFFLACFDIYPAGTLSPGWTCWLKFEGPSDAASRLLDPVILEGYEMEQIEDALRTLPRGVGHVTFPVHCTMARLGGKAILKLLEADPRFTLTLWGEALPQDWWWIENTPQLKGRVFTDCAKPGIISYGLTLAPLVFQRATRYMSLTALGGAAGLRSTQSKDIDNGDGDTKFAGPECEGA